MGKKRNKRAWLTTSDLMQIFSVSRTSIDNWEKEKGLEATRQKVNKISIVRFEATTVLLWAKKHGKEGDMNLTLFNSICEERKQQPAFI